MNETTSRSPTDYAQISKLMRMQYRQEKEIRNYNKTMSMITNPVVEIVAGFVTVDILRHIHVRNPEKITHGIPGLLTWDETSGGFLLGDTAANWCQVGILLAVTAQQMKDNQAARELAGHGIEAIGQVAQTGIAAVSAAFSGMGNAARGLLGVLTGGFAGK